MRIAQCRGCASVSSGNREGDMERRMRMRERSVARAAGVPV